MKPLIVINFKNYEETMGAKGLKLAAYCSTYDNVIICPQFMELDNIKCLSCRIFSQHVDPVVEGAHTGKVSVLAIKKAGVSGSLLNHSENRLSFSEIKKTIELLKSNNLKSIVCCESVEEAGKIAELKPDYIAFEPKKYIGTKTDITEVMKKEIKEIVNIIKPVFLLIGAGINSAEHVRKALKLGAVGVLISSYVAKSRNPVKTIRELANA
ncbi:MAG: triose-phosphate isomerase [Nanoarchaeota archaeon]|nr:triose-phosphate isomerase [Nanoarchaeota archaeon]